MAQDLLSKLVELGLTEYEGRVYLALLQENPVTGYQLSKLSGVPRSMVYEALGRLEIRGAVMRSESRRSSLFRPVQPDILLDRYLDDKVHLVQSLRSSLQDLYSETVEELLWSFHGRAAVLSHARQLIGQAEGELLLVLSDEDLKELSDDAASAHGRGITLGSLLTGTGEFDLGQVARHPQPESEIQGLTNMLIVVQDRRQALIANCPPAGEPRATVTTNPNLVLIAHQFIWMELFAQRVYARLGSDLLAVLDEADRKILEVYAS